MSKHLIITGGSKGIGFATAKRFKEQGWKVINISRQACELEGVTSLCADFSAPNWIDSIKDDCLQAIEHSEQVAVVHNAAMLVKDKVQTIDMTELQRNLAVNLMAPIALNQLLLTKMPRGSSIIYLGSTLSEKAVANAASYVMIKHAVLGLMRATCQDLSGSGIHTCCICPGFTDTEMLRKHLNHDEDILAAITENVSDKRLIHPEEIASFIAYCVDNSVINGSVLHANLGQLER